MQRNQSKGNPTKPSSKFKKQAERSKSNMKTLILLSAIAIIGTIGLECYEKDPYSTTVNKDKVSSTTVENFFKKMNVNDSAVWRLWENQLGKGELECKACIEFHGKGYSMQACAIDSDICNFATNQVKQVFGSVRGCCLTDRCNKVHHNKVYLLSSIEDTSKSSKTHDNSKGIKCRQSLNDPISKKHKVNYKTVSATSVEKYLRIIGDILDIPNSYIDSEKTKYGSGALKCKACMTLRQSTANIQLCDFDTEHCKAIVAGLKHNYLYEGDCCETDGCNWIENISGSVNGNNEGDSDVQCYENDPVATLFPPFPNNEKKMKTTTVAKVFNKIEYPADQIKIDKFESRFGKTELKCKSCLKALGSNGNLQLCHFDSVACTILAQEFKNKKEFDSASCCETDECNKIEDTKPDTNSGDQLNVNLVFVLFSLINPISPFSLFPF